MLSYVRVTCSILTPNILRIGLALYLGSLWGHPEDADTLLFRLVKAGMWKPL